ncbi:amino acid ABC transporter permease [Sneathiella sp.]|uniref:amino acid ABC transporter permease n=1 Tax=Sneathiella sp. TaxID=1964365 RepID=UPI0035694800
MHVTKNENAWGGHPVLHPIGRGGRLFCRFTGIPYVNLTWWHGAIIVATLLMMASGAAAQYGNTTENILTTIIKWTPLMLEGFKMNLLMSVVAMSVGTMIGVVLGLCQVSLIPQVRTSSWLLTQLLRNSPWLVTLFYVMYIIPFEFHIGGVLIILPDWIKATFGLSLPVLANVSEIVRGGVQSIPETQWESARSLAFSRVQTLWMIIIPQCMKRMLPPWMNLYAIVTMATVLGNIVGVSEALTITRDILAAEGRNELLLPMYGYVLFLFFIYIYPISRVTVRLERKWAVDT